MRYRILHHGTAVGTSAKPDSSTPVRVLHEGDRVEIVEIHNLDAVKRTRGRLAAGGWISILNTENGYVWAEPDGPEASKPLKYQVVQEIAGVSLRVTPDSSKPLRLLCDGDLIEIAEIWNIVEAKRIRGRIAAGGWISIRNTENGH